MLKLLRQARKHIVKLTSKIHYTVSAPIRNHFIHDNVPYFCQWESRELAAKILTGEVKTESDPKWKNSGATSPEEYALWSWNVCGMTCLKMILAATKGKTIPLTTLGKKCEEYGGYIILDTAIDGLFYKPFVPFAKKEFGLNVTIKKIITIEDIVIALSKKEFVIASVSPSIRDPKSSAKNKGGHLVLMVGYDLAKKTLYLHNPSGNTVKSQEYAELTFDEFMKFFDEKGMLVSTN